MQRNTLKELRDRYRLTPSEELRNLMREQAMIKGKITRSVSTEKKTIPQISKDTGMDVRTAAYYVLTLTHYRILQPIDKNEDGYWRYQAAKGGR